MSGLEGVSRVVGERQEKSRRRQGKSLPGKGNLREVSFVSRSHFGTTHAEAQRCSVTCLRLHSESERCGLLPVTPSSPSSTVLSSPGALN